MILKFLLITLNVLLFKKCSVILNLFVGLFLGPSSESARLHTYSGKKSVSLSRITVPLGF